MFKRKPETSTQTPAAVVPTERVTSVLGPGISWRGSLYGSGGVRIEGAFEGDLSIRGLIVVGQSGRITTEKLSANTVIVAGLVQGNIVAERLEIRSTGRVWGDVTVVTFTTEDGAFLRGRVQMEEQIAIEVREPEESGEVGQTTGTDAVVEGDSSPEDAE
ncbi:MAG: polymer-forming cytoskeletal protein [Anaerolineae bacterium]|nr:polymer-forming cytoskeletal protein [Anaerolineae bacterium]